MLPNLPPLTTHRRRTSPMLLGLLTCSSLACGGAELISEVGSAASVRPPLDPSLISNGQVELRMNRIDLLALLMEGEIDASDLHNAVFEDEVLLSVETSCNRRTIKLTDMALELPIDATNLELTIVDSFDDRIRIDVDAPKAKATATAKYIRRKIDNGCLTPQVWSDRKEASLTGTVRGLSGSLEASVHEVNGKIQIREIYDVDLHFGEVEMVGTSSNQLEEWLLQALSVVGSFDALVNLGLELVTAIGPVQRLLESALDNALDEAFRLRRAVTLGSGSVEVTGLLEEFEVTQSAFSMEVDLEMKVLEASTCAAGLLRADAGPAIMRRQSGASDFTVFVPRQVIADGLYSGLRTGTFCLPLNLGPVSLNLVPAGRMVVSTGPVVGGSASIHLEIPANLEQNGVVKGTARVAIDVLPTIDAEGQLVATNLNPPQITLSGTILGVTKQPINLANYQAVAQAILNTLFPAGAMHLPLLPKTLDFGSAGYQLRVDEVLHAGSELRVGLDLFLPDTGAGSSSGGGWAGGNGPTDDDDVPSFLPGFDVVPADLPAPEYDESRGDLGDAFEEEFRDQGL